MLMMAQPTSREESTARSAAMEGPDAEEDETFRCADAAGKLDKVPVAVLHDTGADHAGVPGPLDEDIGQDHVLHVDAKECHNGKYHDLLGKESITSTTRMISSSVIRGNIRLKVPSGRPADGAKHGKDSQTQRRPDAVDHAGENAASQIVRSKRIFLLKCANLLRMLVHMGRAGQ